MRTRAPDMSHPDPRCRWWRMTANPAEAPPSSPRSRLEAILGFIVAGSVLGSQLRKLSPSDPEVVTS